MDEKTENSNDNQGITVGNDGTMNQGANIVVKTENTPDIEPVVNDLQPPPTADNISKDDATDVASAVSFIAGDNNDVEENNQSTTSDGIDGVNNNDAGPAVVVAEVKEQEMTSPESTPELSEPQNDSVESSSDSFSVPLAAQAAVIPGAAVTATTPSNMSNNELSQPHPHRNNKKLAIVITLVVALIMAGAAIYVFISAQDNAEEVSPVNSTSTTTQQSQLKPATGTDVEQSLNELDQTIQSVDETDLGEDSISDETLGL